MSIDNRSTDTCKQCGVSLSTFFAPGYCSAECKATHDRRKTAKHILTQLRHDHRFCSTCFGKLKEIEKPPDGRWGTPSCVVGFEYPTEHADHGTTTVSIDDYGRERLARDGLICRCGNTHHGQQEPVLQTRFAFEYAVRLRHAVHDLRAEGKTEAVVDAERLDAALTAHVLPVEESPDSVNWEIVLAAALKNP